MALYPEMMRPVRDVFGSLSQKVLFCLLLALIVCWCEIPSNAAEQRASSVETLVKESKLAEADQQLKARLAAHPDDAAALALLGQVREKQGKYLQAEAAYRQAWKSDAKRDEALLRLADLYMREGRAQEAVPLYERLITLKKQPAFVADLARAYQQSGEYEKSLSIIREIPAASRPDRLLPVMVADYLALKRKEEAQQAADELMHRGMTTKPELIPQLANMFVENGMVGDAGEILKIFSQRQMPTAPYLTSLAKVQVRSGQPGEAKKTILQALALDPKSPDALWTAAQIAGSERDWKTAIAYIKSFRAVAPPTPQVLQSSVYAYQQIGDMQSAYEAALDWQDMQPDSLDSMLALADVDIRGVKMGEAQKLLQKARAKYPNDKRALQAAGLVEFYLGNLDQAEGLLKSSLGLGKGDSQAYFMLGQIDKQRGDMDAAIEKMEKALTIDSTNLEAMAAMGPLYLQMNEPEKARSVLERVVEAAPNDAQSHYQLAQAYRKLGKNLEAQTELEKYQKLRPRHESQVESQIEEKH